MTLFICTHTTSRVEGVMGASIQSNLKEQSAQVAMPLSLSLGEGQDQMTD